VKKPIFSNSVGIWREYGKQLKPLIAELKVRVRVRVRVRVKVRNRVRVRARAHDS
jgi:hypothetical protein